MPPANTTTSSEENTSDDRGGLKFGADIAYDSDSEYISALPTDEEERVLLAGENLKVKEKNEYLDEGMASNHPSTLATNNRNSSGGSEVSTLDYCNQLWMLVWMIQRSCIIHTLGDRLNLFIPSFSNVGKGRSLQRCRRRLGLGEYTYKRSRERIPEEAE